MLNFPPILPYILFLFFNLIFLTEVCRRWIIDLQTQISQLKKLNAAAAAAKSLQSCLTLCDPIDGSPPGPAIPGILQARTLEWVAISSSNAWKWKVKVKLLGRVRLLATPWSAAYQAPPSVGFSRQQYWSGLPFSFPGDPPNPGIEPGYWTWVSCIAGRFFSNWATRMADISLFKTPRLLSVYLQCSA